MTRGGSLFRAAGIAFLVFVSALPGRSAVPLSDYRQQLQQLAEQVERLENAPENAPQILASLPSTLGVRTSSGEVTVNYQYLKDDLAAFSGSDGEKRKALCKQIERYIEQLEAGADAYERPGGDAASARRKLHEVLSRREFRDVHGPTAQDAFVARIYRWLWRILSKLHGPGKGTFKVMQVVVWIVLGGGMLALLLWTISRLTREEDEPLAREIIPFAPSARSWRSWLGEARALADKQDWRNAIHLAYWAGISFLESGGAWKPNRARTPREYLRLLTSRNPKYPPLSRLTRKFEVVWYGNRSAAESDFSETLAQLEELGCR